MKIARLNPKTGFLEVINYTGPVVLIPSGWTYETFVTAK